jgi:tripartite-type tricarboxylate transporter receptor subunit TctC
MKQFFITLCIVASTITSAFAQWKPTGNVEFIVGWPAGGNVDRVGRILAEGFQKQGVQVSVINIAGAGGSIGTNRLIKSPGDGKTVLVNSTSFLFNHLLKSPGTEYHVQKDFIHLLAAGAVQHHLYANPKIKETLPEIIANIRSGKKEYTLGVGSAAQEFSARLIEQKIGKKLNIIVYKGSPQMTTDLLGGHIDLAIDAGTSTLFANTHDGKVKLLATLDASGSDSRGTVDQYLPGVVLQAWFGLSLPKTATPEIVNFYMATMTKVLKDPETKKKLDDIGLSSLRGANFATVIANDYKQFKPVADVINAN